MKEIMNNTNNTQQGSIKWFNPEKGFGFICPSDGGSDLFVHCTNIKDQTVKTFEDGQQVEYTIGESAKGPIAENVELQYSANGNV